MNPLVRIWVDLCFLKAGPQDLPGSRFLLKLTISAYLIVNSSISLANLDGWHAAILAATDLAILTVFVGVLLRARGFDARFVQVLTALTGTGAVLGVLALPLVLVMQQNQSAQTGGMFTALLWLGLMAWSLLVLGNILRHALSTTMGIGMLLGVGYTIVSVVLIQGLFPGLS